MLSESILDTLTFGGLFGSYFDSYDVASTRNQEITQTERTSAYGDYDDYYRACGLWEDYGETSGLLEEN